MATKPNSKSNPGNPKASDPLHNMASKDIWLAGLGAMAQAQAQAPQTTAAAPTWFFCPDSQTYYPYAQSCATPWQRVIPHAPR